MVPTARDSQPEPWPPVQKGQSLPGAGLFAMRLTVVSLAVPFVVCAIAAWAIRAQAKDWLPEGMSGVPNVLWVSTAVILGASWTASRTLRAVREDELARTRRYVIATLALAIGFLILQFVAWIEMLSAFEELPADLWLYKRLFFMLTGLHVCHVVIGIIAQCYLFIPLGANRYWSLHHPGLEYMALYWHFVDGAWIFFLIILLVGW